MGSRPTPLNDETKGLNQHPKNHGFGQMGVDGPALVEIVSSNLRASAMYLCESAIPHMEASVKT
jgi:hypothetical protein